MTLRKRPWHRATLGAAIVLLVSCSGGSGSSSSSSAVCTTCTATTVSLTSADVQTIVAQAVGEAAARNAPATIAVTDRVGNVLAVFRMSGASATFIVSGGRGVSGGLEDAVLPDYDAAISKAITGAYLSSAGNAFSTRTASQIIQQNFNPGELNQPSGPLFGVQFSQLSCSDLMQRATSGGPGPQRSPLGFSAEPGGLPLYKNGAVMGGIGVISSGPVHGAVYGLDLDISDVDQDPDELIAVAGATGYAAPTAVRADRITADGRALRYVDSESLVSTPSAHAAFAALPGALVAVDGYFSGATVKDGVVFGTATSGTRADTGVFADLNGWVLVDSQNTQRYPVVPGSDALLTQAEVQQVLRQALIVANRARAQIRQPLGQAAQVSITVVDTAGNVLGLVRSPDAPLFGIDVALQKARTALLFSQTGAAAQLSALPAARYLNGTDSSIAAYVAASRTFFGNPNVFADGTAYSARAVGNLARPFFPDGLNGSGPGPLSKDFASWSPFSDGLQLDLSYNALVASAGGDPVVGCTGLPQARNGIQIFPGSVPIYRGHQLIGAIGVSGDGVDQDDLVAFLGLAKSGAVLGTGVGNAPAEIRADQLVPQGARLRYVQCPQTPFIDSSEQDVCSGL